jgi:hypothetical protein
MGCLDDIIMNMRRLRVTRRGRRMQPGPTLRSMLEVRRMRYVRLTRALSNRVA